MNPFTVREVFPGPGEERWIVRSFIRGECCSVDVFYDAEMARRFYEQIDARQCTRVSLSQWTGTEYELRAQKGPDDPLELLKRASPRPWRWNDESGAIDHPCDGKGVSDHVCFAAPVGYENSSLVIDDADRDLLLWAVNNAERMIELLRPLADAADVFAGARDEDAVEMIRIGAPSTVRITAGQCRAARALIRGKS
jgi:hypothetical protein